MRLLITHALFADAGRDPRDKSFEKLIPDIHVDSRSMDAPIVQKLLGDHRIIKSHILDRFTKYKMIYIFRRPEDSFISSYFQALGRSDPENLAREMGPDWFCLNRMEKWANHVTLANTTADHGDVFMVCYEDMLDHTVPILKGVMEFLECQVEQASLQAAVQQTEFSKLQRKYPNGERPMFRKGVKGDARNHLTKKTLDTIEYELGNIYRVAHSKVRYEI